MHKNSVEPELHECCFKPFVVKFLILINNGFAGTHFMVNFSQVIRSQNSTLMFIDI